MSSRPHAVLILPVISRHLCARQVARKADDTSVDEEEDGEPFAHIVDQDATGRAPVRKQDLKHRRQKKKKLVGELRLVAAEIQPRGATLKS